MNYKAFSELVCALDYIDKDGFPETFEYVFGLTRRSDSCKDLNARKVPNHILQCDLPKDFSRVIINMITDILNDGFEYGAGDPDAMCDLGTLYMDGIRGFRKDPDKATGCYKLAAEYGSLRAARILGHCYYRGNYLPQNYECAYRYFSLAAFQGDINSLCMIAEMYENGRYVDKNEGEAFRIVLSCLTMITGDPSAEEAGPLMLRLGNCFLNSIGTEPDAKAALMCFQNAESYLYDLVKSGFTQMKKSLNEAIDGQIQARRILAEEMELKKS